VRLARRRPGALWQRLWLRDGGAVRERRKLDRARAFADGRLATVGEGDEDEEERQGGRETALAPADVLQPVNDGL
jgi:hypothetical protein